MKRILTLLLACTMTAALLSGCAKQETASDPLQAALDAYAPDTVVMTIDGTQVHWNEFAYWLCTTAKQFARDAGVPVIEDWNAVYDEQTGETYADALLRTVTEQLKQFHSLEAQAADFGLEPGADGDAYVEQSVAESLSKVPLGDGEDSDKALKRFSLDRDVLRYQARIAYLELLVYQEMFGADGEKLSEDDLNDYVAQKGYMTAKHILLSTADSSNQPLPDDVKAEKLESAKRIIERLRKIEDPAELVREFDRYAGEYNEDPGVASYPNGYCFCTGQMDPAFEAGTAALQPYEVSPEPVESAYGYHVILRMPTTGDEALDVNADGTPYTLRSDAAQAIYEQLIRAWIDDAEIQWAEGFETLDVQALFTGEETFLEKLDFLHWFHD